MDKIKINPLVYPLATKGLITNVTKNNFIRFSQSELLTTNDLKNYTF